MGANGVAFVTRNGVTTSYARNVLGASDATVVTDEIGRSTLFA